jgi:MFS family permease
VYGLTSTIYQVTGIVGPPLGGLLAAQFGFKPMLLCATIFYSVAAGLRIWMARTMRSAGEREPRPLTTASLKSSLLLIWTMLIAGGVITWIFITDGVHDIAFRLSDQLQPIYLQEIGGLTLAQIGLLGSFFSAAMMLTPMLSGKLADRYGERVPISAGFLVIAGSIALFLVAKSYPAFILVWILAGCGDGLLTPAYQSLISKVVPSESLGAFNGVFYSSVGFIALPAPWIGAQLWERYSPRLPFSITMVVCFLSVIPIWLKFKLPDKAAAEATT